MNAPINFAVLVQKFEENMTAEYSVHVTDDVTIFFELDTIVLDM